MVRRIAVPGAVGAFAGATLLSGLSTEQAGPWMAALLLALGTYLLVRFSVGGVTRRPGRLRSRFLVPVGLVAGFVDATGGGGWGPVATPALLASGRLEPRRVVGSVDTSEFVVAVAASAGFLAGLGAAAIDPVVVTALLAGGLVAAPVAAALVRFVPPRLLGAGVGGLIVLTNTRTLLGAAGAESGAAAPVYACLAAVWAAAIALAVVRHRRERALGAEASPSAGSAAGPAAGSSAGPAAR